jgi:hypothetical protein
MHYAHNMCDPHWSTWHLLHGSRTFNSTVGGTIGLMYVWNAKIAWRASTSTCVHNKKHLPNLFTEHLGEPWVVSKVMSSSDVAAPTIWHINSTRLLVEKNWWASHASAWHDDVPASTSYLKEGLWKLRVFPCVQGVPIKDKKPKLWINNSYIY